MSETDCILFIDEEIAKIALLIERLETTEPDILSRVAGISRGQVSSAVELIKTMGIINDNNGLTGIARKAINTIIKKHAEALT